MRIHQRFIALTLSLLMMLGCLCGCSQEPEQTEAPALETSAPSGAKGRYVQEEVPMPDCFWVQDMVMLSDGQLRFADRDYDGNITIYTGSPDGSNWEASYLPEDVTNCDYVTAIALHSDGSIFCACSTSVPETQSYVFHAWLIDSSGACREIPVSHPDPDPNSMFLITGCDFTEQGKVVEEFRFQEVREIDLETGALSDNLNAYDIYPGMGAVTCAGEDIYILGTTEGMIYRDGQAELLSGVLGDQLIGALKAFEGYDKVKVSLWQDAQGYLFFTTHEGLFSYVPGGSVTEELVSGARSTLGDPTFFASNLVGDNNGVLYVLGNYTGGGCGLYRYYYDSEAPIASETQLRMYSLYADEDLQQMVSQYQIANPEVSIDLEIGVTGEDGITETDALRTLNTQILAGDGPDLVCLDGFSLESYLEKDVLLDLTSILSQAEPLLEQVTNCYAQDGKICAVPTTFALPAVYGPNDLISQIQDLDSLVEAALQAKADGPEARSVFMGIRPETFADQFYDSCSAAWITDDGTLDEEKLTAFYQGMRRLYSVDEGIRIEMADTLEEWRQEEDYTPGAYTRIHSSMSICNGTQCMTAGTLEGMEHYGYVLAGDDYLNDYDLAALNGQSTNVFLPRRIMGILSTSENQEAAGQFLQFILSDAVQSEDLSTGFPVNKTTFEREIREERTLTSSMSGSDAEGNDVFYTSKYPEANRRQALQTWVDNLTTPASTDRIIRSTVIEQLTACLDGDITPEEAAQEAIQALNLYLSE